jgi:hypothetical protein
VFSKPLTTYSAYSTNAKLTQLRAEVISREEIVYKDSKLVFPIREVKSECKDAITSRGVIIKGLEYFINS